MPVKENHSTIVSDQSVLLSPSSNFGGDSNAGHHKWFLEDIAEPLVDGAMLRPLNAITSVLNTSSGCRLLPKVDLLAQADGRPRAPSTVQKIFEEIGSLAPYLVSSKIAGYGLAKLSNTLEKIPTLNQCAMMETVSAGLSSRSLSSITGGAFYGFAQEPDNGQTRLGNSVGSAIAFGAFELGGALSEKSTVTQKLGVRLGVGFVGGIGQMSISNELAHSNIGSGPDLIRAGLAGAAAGALFPTVAEGLGSALSKASQKFKTLSWSKSQLVGAETSTSKTDLKNQGQSGSEVVSSPPFVPQRPISPERFAELGKQILEQINQGSLPVKKAQLAYALNSSEYSGEQAQALAGMYRLFDQLHNLSGSKTLLMKPSISSEDLDAYLKAAPTARDFNGRLNRTLERTVTGQNAARGNYSLFGAADSPSVEAVQQGYVPNCGFEAALASIVKVRPELIRNMIRDNEDGTYTVTFPGDKNHPVIVKAPTEAEQGLFNGASENGVWASVLEKASGQYQSQKSWFRNRGSLQDLTRYTKPENAFTLLTGKPSLVVSLTRRQQDLPEILQSVADKGYPATASSKLILSRSLNSSEKITESHSYSIIDFRAKTNGNAGPKLSLRDPWGHGSSAPGGLSELTLDKFRNSFSSIIINKIHDAC